jgi:hypothetical protein
MQILHTELRGGRAAASISLLLVLKTLGNIRIPRGGIAIAAGSAMGTGRAC